MARIRTLKPEFWDSPSTAAADLAVRLTFMAMWNWADDSGQGTANLKELEAFVFPHDEVTELPRRSSGNSAGSAGRWRNFAEICGEVADVYGVVFYRVNNRPYYCIPSFKDHQSKDYRAKSRYPSVEEGEIYDVISGNAVSDGSDDAPQVAPSAPMRGNSAGSSGKSGIGTGEQGNRGTGEQGSTPVGGETDSPPGKPSFEHQVNDVTRDAYAAINKSANFMALRGIAKWCLKDRGIDGAEFRDAVVSIYGMGKPITKQTVGQFLDGHLGGRGASARESRMQANLRLVEELAAEAKGIEQ